MLTNPFRKCGGVACARNFTLSIFFCALACISLPSCTTTKDASGNTTTSFDVNSPASQAAIAAATQIAVAAANAAISTYLVAPQLHARARLSMANPAISAAEIATEDSIARAKPTLPPTVIHNIVTQAYAERLLRH